MTAPLRLGDRVAFSAVYLRSIGSTAGQRCAWRGQVVGFAPDWPDLALVEWGTHRSHVNIGNLIHARDICLDATTADVRSGYGPQGIGR